MFAPHQLARSVMWRERRSCVLRDARAADAADALPKVRSASVLGGDRKGDGVFHPEAGTRNGPVLKDALRAKAYACGAATALLGAALFLFPGAAQADSLTLEFSGGEGAFASRLAQIIMLVTAISLAPAIVVAGTAFVRIAVTLSILRAALGLQQTPPNMVLVSLALFLTAFVMAPTMERSWREGIQPLMAEEIAPEEGFAATVQPLRDFMNDQVDARHLAAFERLLAQHESPDASVSNEDDAFEFLNGSPEGANAEEPREPALRALAPAFIVSELSRAFEIGFLLFLPFLVIDLVVAAVLMSMGMMMLPPAVVSLPFKLIFFVLIDGWRLVSEGLALSFL